MNFPGYITNIEAQKLGRQLLEMTRTTQVNEERHSCLESLDLLEKLLPELKMHAGHLALPIEIEGHIWFSKQRVMGGWIIGKFYNDGSSTSIASYISYVALREDGRLVSGLLIERAGQPILVAKKYQLSRKAITGLFKKVEAFTLKSLSTLGGCAQEYILKRPEELNVKLLQYINNDYKTFGDFDW